MQAVTRTRKWLVGIAVATMLAIAGPLATATIAPRRVEAYLRAQVVEYLGGRFESDVELGALRVHLPETSTLRLLLTGGRGALARVESEGLSLRHEGRRDVPPVLAVNRLRFEVDLGTLFDTPLSGNYTFENPDLGVFPAIAGILDSTGRFEGALGSIRAKGQAVGRGPTRTASHPPATGWRL